MSEEQQIFNTVENTNPEKKKSNPGCLLAILAGIFLVIPFFVILFVVIGFLYFFASKESVEFDLNSYNVQKKEVSFDDYIEPGSDSESVQLFEDSTDKFVFEYAPGVSTTKYEYEKQFILSNLQQEYLVQSKRFNSDFNYKIKIIFLDDQDQYERDFGKDYNYDLSYGAFSTYGEIEFYVYPGIDYDKQDFKRLISHELVHLFQFDNNSFVFSNTPIWFYEGSAEYFSDAPSHSLSSYNTAPHLLTLDALTNSFDSNDSDTGGSAYLVSNHFIRYLGEEYGDQKLVSIIQSQDYRDFDEIFFEIYRETPDTLYSEWVNSR